MLPDGLATMYRNALASSHRPYLLLEVLDGNQRVLAHDVEYLAGGVDATLTSRVARTCQVTLDDSFYPYQSQDLMAPYGNMLRASRGVEFADGTRYAWVVFVGRIQSARLGVDGTCTISAADFGVDVVDNRFVRPENSQPANLVSNEVRRLISDAVPAAVFGTFQVDDIPVRPLTWQLERGQALDELATSVGAFWYALNDGRFTLRTYPWTVISPAVVTLSDGPTGIVVNTSATRTREDVYNVLTVTGERLNGDPAVYATASDINPDSPTYVNGNFGIRSELMRLQTPSTSSGAAGAARDNLKRLAALTDSWEWDMVPDASLELGDTVSLNVRGRSDIVQVVAGFHIPLDLSGAMRVRGRAQIFGTIEGVS